MNKSPNLSIDESRERPNNDQPPRMPRWVKLAGAIAIILVLLFVILKLTGIGGEHGPGRHLSGSMPVEKFKQMIPEGKVSYEGDLGWPN